MGPEVSAGMPEAGSLPLHKALAAAGVKDMVRISDARMSGTAYGNVVLHVCPEAAVGGPLALVRDGDLIDLDVEAGRLDLLVDEAELDRRRAGWTPPQLPARGWARLHAKESNRPTSEPTCGSCRASARKTSPPARVPAHRAEKQQHADWRSAWLVAYGSCRSYGDRQVHGARVTASAVTHAHPAPVAAP